MGTGSAGAPDDHATLTTTVIWGARGGWTAAVYTAEQQARLGVNEQGESVGAAAAAAKVAELSLE